MNEMRRNGVRPGIKNTIHSVTASFLARGLLAPASVPSPPVAQEATAEKAHGTSVAHPVFVDTVVREAEDLADRYAVLSAGACGVSAPHPALFHSEAHVVMVDGVVSRVSGWLDPATGQVVSDAEFVSRLAAGSQVEREVAEMTARWAAREKLRSRISGDRASAAEARRAAAISACAAALVEVSGVAVFLPPAVSPGFGEEQSRTEVTVLSERGRDRLFGGWSMPSPGSACSGGVGLPAGGSVLSLRGCPAGLVSSGLFLAADGLVRRACDGVFAEVLIGPPVDGVRCGGGCVFWDHQGVWRDEPPGSAVVRADFFRGGVEAVLSCGFWFGAGDAVPQGVVWPMAIDAERYGMRASRVSSDLVSRGFVKEVLSGVTRPVSQASDVAASFAEAEIARAAGEAGRREAFAGLAADRIRAWVDWMQSNARIVRLGSDPDGDDALVSPWSPALAWGEISVGVG